MMGNYVRRSILLAALAGMCCAAGFAEEPIGFNRQIQPILSDKCFTCHGPDATKRKAELRLDVAASATQKLPSGTIAVVPGKRAESELWRRITAEKADDRMPPADQTRQLTKDEIELIGKWIDQGAKFEKHWSFEAPKLAQPPAVKNAAWPHNGIDYFILSRLEQEGLQGAQEADKRTLIRRVTLDLTGLPPTLDEIDAFLADDKPDAYERLVDRLLASPRYGEQMARYWLDLSRYADTNGYHIDNERYMWPWRDWVIEAFNKNEPFDEFTIDQIAGDLRPNATVEQKTGSGFNRNHMINFEGGAIDEEFRTQYVIDRTNTTGTVWLGLSVGCAQCHDHKFDPVSQKEYYQLFSFFNTLQEVGLDGRDGNANPIMKVPGPEQKAKLDELDAKLKDTETKRNGPLESDTAQTTWEADATAQAQKRWARLTPKTFTATGGATLALQADNTLLAGAENPGDCTFECAYETDATNITALRLESLVDPSLPDQGPGRGKAGNFVLSEFEAEVVSLKEPGTSKVVKFAVAEADHAQENFPIELALDGKPDTGWAAEGYNRHEARTAIFYPTQPFGYPGGSRITVRMKHETQFKQHAIGRFAIALSTDSAIGAADLGGWYHAGPYAATDGKAAYDTAYDPEKGVNLDERYPDGRFKWVERPDFKDKRMERLPGGVCANYLYRAIKVGTPRTMTLALGSNDALKVWLNGRVILDKNIQRTGAPDQDMVDINLDAGENKLLLKVVNYGGAHQYFFNTKKEQRLPVPMPLDFALAKAADLRSDADKAAVRDYYRRHFSEEWKKLDAQYAELTEQRKAVEKDVPTTMVMAEMQQPRETRMLRRGQYDQPFDKVEPATPAALPAFPANAPKNRLGLAQWLVSRENPLTARVAVNRVWMQFFGTGLVKTAEDFGTQGERPSHPELLDWLAVTFQDQKWDLKALQKIIVMSAAYRQRSNASPELVTRDPENRLLARGPRFRMDGEMVRDNALAISGLLVGKIGGKSVNPYGPSITWKEVAYGDGFTGQIFVQGKGEDLYRRSMYTFWKRQAPPSPMLLLDAPNREVCTVRRARTNTPLQALMLMNDPQYVEAARAFAQRLMKEIPAPEARIDRAYQLAVARPPSDNERAILLKLLNEQLTHYKNDPKAAEGLITVGDSKADASLDKAELAAWSTVASVVLNLDETITKG